MSQASDLGAVANQLAALYRARVNANIQAVVTQHYGASEPPVMYPNMLWLDSGTNSIKLRDPTNTTWTTVGTVSPFKWTAVDLPQTAFTTGDVKLTFKTAADPAWVMMNDGSIGDASSGAATRANSDCEALFALLWERTGDAWCKVYAAGGFTPTGRGASAAADWAAHRHILLPKVLGRALAVAGWGAGLSNKLLASWEGTEAVALGLNNLPAHLHTLPTHTHGPGSLQAASAGAHTHGYTSYGQGAAGWSDYLSSAVYPQGATTSSNGAHTHALSGQTDAGGGGSTGAAGSAEAHANIPPTSFLNVMIKL